MKKEEKVINGIMGFILGDAIGVPYEFKDRKYIDNVDMIGNGSHNVAKGTWSDDSSMVIATMKAIIDNKGNINYVDIMNNFMLWAENKDFNVNNRTFGIGRTTLRSLNCYKYRNEFKEYENPINCGPSDFNDNGNGSLMRILPIAYYCYYKDLNDSEIFNLVKDMSCLTHSNEISILGCYIYVLFTMQLLKGNDKQSSYNFIRNYNYNMFKNETIDYYKRLLNNDISLLNSNDISGVGFVVDTLEAVIWTFMNNDNYKDSIINAIKLGNDTDTIGALVGGISGIYYGNLPSEWLNEIARKDYLIELCKEYEEAL